MDAASTTSVTIIGDCGGGRGVTSNPTFTIFGPPPAFPAPPRSIDFSPLKLILAVIAVIALPALAYALFFYVPCPCNRIRRRRSFRSDDLPVHSPHLPSPTKNVPGAGSPVLDVKSQKESHHSKEKTNDCTICLLVFADGADVCELSACKHAFHASCLAQWLALSDNPTCPNCRAAVNVDGNVIVNRNGGGCGNRSVSVDEWHQRLPDALSFV